MNSNINDGSNVMYKNKYKNKRRERDRKQKNNTNKKYEERKNKYKKKNMTLKELYKRKWSTLNYNSSLNDISISSYNLLCQDYVQESYYPYCPRPCLRNNFRRNNIYYEFKKYRSDIICLQEVSYKDVNQFWNRQFDALGYHSLFSKRPQYREDGCFLAFKRNKFDLIDETIINFEEYPTDFVDKPNIAQVVLLKTTGDALLCVSNLHLLYNPKRGDIKLAQVQYLLCELNSWLIQSLTKNSYTDKNVLLILCGDFNCTPTSLLRDLIINGQLYYPGLDRSVIDGQLATLFDDERKIFSNKIIPEKLYSTYNPKHDDTIFHNFNFKSSYVELSHSEPEFTSFHKRFKGTVDYIFYDNIRVLQNRQLVSDSNTKDSYHPKAVLLLPPNEKLKTARTLLPNSILSSDHFLLSAKFGSSKIIEKL